MKLAVGVIFYYNYYNFIIVKNIKFASIGPVTRETMRKYRLTVDFEAKVYDVNGIIEAIK